MAEEPNMRWIDRLMLGGNVHGHFSKGSSMGGIRALPRPICIDEGGIRIDEP